MWDGYFTLEGTEIINVARTEALAAHKPWFKPVFENASLPLMLGDDPATYADVINAPWFDPDQDASFRFFGAYPLNVTGIEDSSRSSNIVESTADGGVAGRIRHGMKAAVFNVVLLAEDAEAAEFGMRWLKRVLLGPLCSPLLATETVLGGTLGYVASAPVWEPNPAIGQTAQYPIIGRTLRRVVFNNGPSILNKANDLFCGGAAWNAQFSAAIGMPYEYGFDRAILQGYMDPLVTDPWAPGVTVGSISGPAPFDDAGGCGDNLWAPIYDPLCPALIVPPAPPSVPLGCYDPPDLWSRRKVTIPADLVPLVGEVVPILELSADVEARNVRLRFYRDPDGTFDPDDFPCDFLGDALISYIPAGGSIVLDGTTQEIFVITLAGKKRRADSLVFRSDGKPFIWPALMCGYQHILTVDMPDGVATFPVLDLSLTHRVV